MRAAILRNRRIEVGDVPVPEPGPGEVLVKTLACGICGSDLHIYHQARDDAAGGGGIVMGHEFVGEIVDYGPDTNRRLKPGTRVNSIPILGRKTGAEFIGYSADNPGGYGEFMRLTEDHLLEIPNGLATEHAALTEPMSVGWHAVNRARLQPGDVPLVVGCGPIGLAVIAGLKIKNIHPIVAASRSAKRRELALAMGADIVVDPNEHSPYEAWREQAQTGRPDPGPTLPGWLVGSGLKPAVIFECVGGPKIIDEIMAGAPQDARIVVVGLCFEAAAFQPMTGMRKELDIVFSNSFHRHEYAETLHHLAEGKIDAAPLVTGKVGVGGVEAAFHDLANPISHAKILIEPWHD
ncbi:MAG TPA: zinc-binding dehydrogenase [Stellaceae bacterium]